MDKCDTHADRVVYITGDKIDREKWDHCIDRAVNGNICGYSWFLDIMCRGWGALVVGDYDYIMPVPVARRFGISYLFQPRFIQQLGVFGAQSPDVEIIRSFLEALPKEIKVVDYHFNEQNSLPPEWNVTLQTNLLLKIDKSYNELRLAYSLNLIRKLKKSDHSDLHIIKNDNPESLIKLFRDENGVKFSSLKDNDYRRLNRVINACLNRGIAKVWSVYNREKELCGGAIWLFSHDRAVFYFSAQSKAGKEKGVLAWLIDAFIHENATSGIVLDFEGSMQPGLARFYRSFSAVSQLYPRLTINRLSPFLKMVYIAYRKLKKD